MAEITNERIFEVLKQVQQRPDRVDHKVDELKSEMGALRGHMISLQQDTHNIYAILGRHELRFDRIEQRLDLQESPV